MASLRSTQYYTFRDDQALLYDQLECTQLKHGENKREVAQCQAGVISSQQDSVIALQIGAPHHMPTHNTQYCDDRHEDIPEYDKNGRWNPGHEGYGDEMISDQKAQENDAGEE